MVGVYLRWRADKTSDEGRHFERQKISGSVRAKRRTLNQKNYGHRSGSLGGRGTCMKNARADLIAIAAALFVICEVPPPSGYRWALRC